MNNFNFNKAFDIHTRGIEDHQFRHYNNSMGCMIYSKEHYKHEMRRRNMVPYDIAEEMAEEYDRNNPRKEYDELSPKAMDIIRSLKQTADKHGNLILGNRAIKALQEIGAMPVESDENIHSNSMVGGFS